MKIKGKATVLFDRDRGMTIEIQCSTSSTTFAVAHLDPMQTMAVLSRQAMVDCDVTVRGLDHVGKVMEIGRLEFRLPNCSFNDRESVAEQVAMDECPDGWTPDLSFSSRDSFFNKGNQKWGRTIIRRYVELSDDH